MGTITKTKGSGRIVASYEVDGITAVNHDGKEHAVTRIDVNVWHDGEVEAELHGVPLTKNGNPDKRRIPTWIIPTDPRTVPGILAELGISTDPAAVFAAAVAAGAGDDE